MNRMHDYWRQLNKGTDSEWAIEPAIAALGRPYRWQYPFWEIRRFADFALIDDKLVIEIDGDSHLKPAQAAKDLETERLLNSMGWQVVRCRNEAAVLDPWGTVNDLMVWAGLPYRVVAPATWDRRVKPPEPSSRRSGGAPNRSRSGKTPQSRRRSPR